jgi:hypothetical protein
MLTAPLVTVEVKFVLAASDYPFLDVVWTLIIFFLWVAWFWILISILADIFRRHDISGWAKAGWVLLVIVIPFIGVLIYVGVNGKGMAERNVKDQQVARSEADDYIRTVAGSGGGAAAEIEKAKQLLDTGAITEAEYAALKQKALATGPA